MTTDILIKVDLLRNGFEESKQNHKVLQLCISAVMQLSF